MDLGPITGLLIALIGIFFGFFLEGGNALALLHFEAGLIVFASTFGIVVISNTKSDLFMSFKLFLKTFQSYKRNYRSILMEEIVECARVARRKSILSLDERIKKFPNKFMKDVFRSLVDGVDAQNLREIFLTEINVSSERKFLGAKVWTDAGGYAPTMGILGAVLGLIQVMNNLTDTANLGKGIGVAFIATIYGIGSANIIFIPIANKIKNQVQKEIEIKKMILEGAIGIVNGLSPYIIHEKMHSFNEV